MRLRLAGCVQGQEGEWKRRAGRYNGGVHTEQQKLGYCDGSCIEGYFFEKSLHLRQMDARRRAGLCRLGRFVRELV